MMKLAYLDCASGISGDMTLGALVDAGVELETLNQAITSLGLPRCVLSTEEVRRKGFRATLVKVDYEPEQSHRHLHHITAMIDQGRLTNRQKDLARQIFTKLAEAEARVHGTSIEKVHFHEVGAADSIADIVGAAVGWDLLGADRIVASAVPTGTGKIRIAHGECSLPAPATAELLTGIPLAESSIPFELTTPTGAAILATLVERFGPIPAMTIEQIGYGAGGRDLDNQPNLLRLFVGHAASEESESEQVWVVETNLDDISGEWVGYCTTRLWEAGALDVFTTPIQMKKNRPGVMISVLCHLAVREAVEAILFTETTTLGVRRWPVDRSVLDRRKHSVETTFGTIEGKLGLPPHGPPRFAPEYESCRRVAIEQNVPLRMVFDAAQRAYRHEATE